MSKIHRVVVGYDFSELGDLAVRSAFEIASREERGEVHVVNVTAPIPDVLITGMAGAVVPTVPPIEDAFEALEARLGRLMATWQEESHRTFSRLTAHVRSATPATDIAQLASDLEAELVIVGTHGRKGLERLLLGSVAEAVIRVAPCPVLVVRPPRSTVTVATIEAPCPDCLEVRRQTDSEQLWCERHSHHHGAAHTYHYQSRVGTPTNSPLVVRQS